MVRHGLKHIFQKPTPDIDSSDRTQQLRSKTIYAGTVDLAQTLANGSNNKYKTLFLKILDLNTLLFTTFRSHPPVTSSV